MTRARIYGLLASVFIPALAHATPVDDFKAGTILYLRSGAIHLGGSASTTGGVKLSKPANTLDFDLDATAIGSPLPITVHLVAVAQGTAWIEYQFNWNNGPLPIDGDGDTLYTASGQIVLKLGHSPSDLRAYGNLTLDSDPAQPNYMLAVGNWGNQVINIDQVSAFGGVLPASLSNFWSNGSSETCSAPTPVKTSFSVALDNPAPPGGQVVTLHSADHAGVAVPPQVVVPAGHDSTTFDATIAPGFVGQVELQATGNGAFKLFDLDVDKEQDCQPGNGSGVPTAYNPDSECIACTVNINDWGEKIELVGRVVEVIRGTTVATLASFLPKLAPTSITAVSYGDGGYVAGELTANGVTQGYRANIDHMAGKADLLGTFSPAMVNRYGTMVGSMPDPATERSHAAISNGHTSSLLPIANLDAYQSTALFVSDNGEVVGTYILKLGDVTRGFRVAAKGATALPEVGTIPGIPVAANASGQIALNGKDATGANVAGVVDSKNQLTLLGSPTGYTSFQITGMNGAGWIVGTAQSTTGRVTRAFVWQPRTGFRALSGYNRALPTVDNVLAITDSFTAVVHATTSSGATNLYTLPL